MLGFSVKDWLFYSVLMAVPLFMDEYSEKKTPINAAGRYIFYLKTKCKKREQFTLSTTVFSLKTCHFTP
jgi:hypothetical protein